jgi:hypothetical protein
LGFGADDVLSILAQVVAIGGALLIARIAGDALRVSKSLQPELKLPETR